MKTHFLQELKDIKRVETPDFLFERIVSKIETEELKDNKSFSLTLAFTFLLILINTSILTNYMGQEIKSSQQEITNPFNFSTYTLIENE